MIKHISTFPVCVEAWNLNKWTNAFPGIKMFVHGLMGLTSRGPRSFMLQQQEIRQQFINLVTKIGHKMKFSFWNELTTLYHGWRVELTPKTRRRSFWICSDNPVSSANLLTAYKLVEDFFKKIKHHVCSFLFNFLAFLLFFSCR